MSRPIREIPLPARVAARRAFDRASATFDTADVVHGEARQRLLQRLPLLHGEPTSILDLGCATGKGALSLAQLYPAAQVLAVDASSRMLQQAGRRCARWGRVALLAGDAERLPICDASIDLVFANLLLPWCSLEAVLLEVARVLKPGGLLLLSTVGPDTLQEIRRAWYAVDDRAHVHAFTDMHDVGDRALAAGLAEPVLDVDRLEITYRDLQALLGDLRCSGAANVATGRREALTGRQRWARFVQAMDAGRRDGKLVITVELVFGQAWGTGRSRIARAASGTVGVPLAELTKTLPRR